MASASPTRPRSNRPAAAATAMVSPGWHAHTHGSEDGFGQYRQGCPRLLPQNARHTSHSHARVQDGRQCCEAGRGRQRHGAKAPAEIGRHGRIAGQDADIGNCAPLHGTAGAALRLAAPRQRLYGRIGGDIGGLAGAAHRNRGRAKEQEEFDRVLRRQPVEIFGHAELGGEHAG